MDDIAACLAPDGWLLVLEDQRMNVGELPHDKGFLVLDGVELQELFGVSDREPDARNPSTNAVAVPLVARPAACWPEVAGRGLLAAC